MDLLHFKDNASNRDVISLFSGAMGLDIGLTKAGLNVVIGQDFDPACVATMRVNGHKVLEGDIREIDESDLLEQAGLVQGEPFLICGGPPCQPFSTAGKRLGINDPRGSLFMDFIRMIDYIRPRFFIMENVKGIMSAPLKHARPIERDKNDPEQQLGTVLDVILSEFDKLGYKTVYGLLDAVNYGVPQFRERFVLIGSRDNENIFLLSQHTFRCTKIQNIAGVPYGIPSRIWSITAGNVPHSVKTALHTSALSRRAGIGATSLKVCGKRPWGALMALLVGKLGFTGGYHIASHPRHWLHPQCKKRP